jgi:hypothetical protein
VARGHLLGGLDPPRDRACLGWEWSFASEELIVGWCVILAQTNSAKSAGKVVPVWCVRGRAVARECVQARRQALAVVL